MLFRSRFTARAQVRPEEVVAILIPNADPRTVDIERVMLWADSGGRRLDPLALLGAPVQEQGVTRGAMRTA